MDPKLTLLVVLIGTIVALSNVNREGVDQLRRVSVSVVVILADTISARAKVIDLHPHASSTRPDPLLCNRYSRFGFRPGVRQIVKHGAALPSAGPQCARPTRSLRRG